jgi:hypothetical protein
VTGFAFSDVHASAYGDGNDEITVGLSRDETLFFQPLQLASDLITGG